MCNLINILEKICACVVLVYNVWARIVSEGKRSYAPWLSDVMTARSGEHDLCTNTLKYE